MLIKARGTWAVWTMLEISDGVCRRAGEKKTGFFRPELWDPGNLCQRSAHKYDALRDKENLPRFQE